MLCAKPSIFSRDNTILIIITSKLSEHAVLSQQQSVKKIKRSYNKHGIKILIS